jgi:hypothetical protein
MAQKKKQEIFTEDYNTVSNSTRILRLEWLEWELMQKKPEGGQYEWVMEAPKKWMMILQVVLRGATKDTKTRVTNQKRGIRLIYKKMDEIENYIKQFLRRFYTLNLSMNLELNIRQC